MTSFRNFFAVLIATLLCAGAISRAAIEGDALVSYAAGYVSSEGGEDNAQVTIANAVAGANGSSDRSGTGAHIRVVAYYQSLNDVTGQTTTGGIVNWLAADSSQLADVVSYGATVGADQTIYINANSDQSTIAGVSQQPGMYSSLNPGAVWTAVLAHESLGHTWGRSHGDGVASPVTIMLNNYCTGGGAAPPYYFTNQYIWFNGVQLYETANITCGQGPLVNGGDNSIPIGTTAQSVSNRRDRIVYGPNINNIIYDWRFTNAPASAPAGTTIADSVSGALATVRGNGAVFTGSSVRIPGGTTGAVAMSSMSAYVDLPNNILSSNTNITIEIWATPQSAPNNARILDFGICNTAGDGLGATGEYTGAPSDPAPGATQSLSAITLSCAMGTNLSTQLFQAKMSGTSISVDGGIPNLAKLQHHYVLTYTSGTGAFSSSGGGRWNWYYDGDAVTYIDVAYPLSAINDVNNWLGRSLWSQDSLANNDYTEVRISNAALTQGQVAANYRLGPLYNPGATVSMTVNDASGSSSFSSAGHWSSGAAPTSGSTYETYDFTMRTPANSGGGTFGGGSLIVSGGRLYYAGTASSTITVNNLILNGASQGLSQVYQGGSGTCTLAGNVLSTGSGGVMNAVNGAFNLTANLSGSAPMTYVNGTTTLSGNNSGFTGQTMVGAGAGGTIILDSEARLGPNPTTFNASALDLNRGTIQTTQTMSLSNPNRGILLDISAGMFNVTTGTLTLACPISSPNLGSSVFAGAIRKSGPGTLLLTTTNSTFNGSLYVDSGSTTANDGAVRIVNNVALASAHSPIFIIDSASANSTLLLDGSAANITLTQSVQMNGRSSNVAAIESLTGTNSIGGITTEPSTTGNNYLVQSDSGLLKTTGAITGGSATGFVVTFQGAGNISTNGAITNGQSTAMNVSKTGAGTLTLAGANTYTGATTLNQGTLTLNGSLNPSTGASSALTTSAGTVFGGTGSTSVTVNIAGTHSPGNPLGTQTINGPLKYSAASKLNCLLTANSTGGNNLVAAQSVSVANGAAINVVLNNTGSGVDLTNSFWTTAHSWTVMTGTAINGSFYVASTTTDPAGHSVSGVGSFYAQQTATAVTLNFIPPTMAPPQAPGSVTATSFPRQVNLTWTVPAEATSFNVKRATTSGGPYTTIATGVTTPNYVDTTVASGVTYYYIITAVSQYGESVASAQVVGSPHPGTVINKADNTVNLTQAASWTNSILPGAGDIANWTGLAGSNSVALGADMPLKGIAIATTGGAVTLAAGNTLTLGTSGFDLSAASQDLTVNTGLSLSVGTQTWNVISGHNLNLATGAFTRVVGSTLALPGAGNVAMSMSGMANDASGIIGAWASAGTSTSTRYVTLSGGSLVGYTSGSSVAAFGWTSTNPNTTNYDVAGVQTALGIARGANAVRYTGAAGSQNWGNNNTTAVTLNGLMNAGTGLLTFTQAGGGSLGQVAIGTNNNNELVLTAASAPLTIAIPIIDSGVPGTVTVCGPNTTTLSAANTFSGGLYLDSGTLVLGANAGAGAGLLTLAGGTLSSSGNLVVPNAILIAPNTAPFVQSGASSGLDLGGSMTGTGDLSLTGIYGSSAVRLGGSNGAFAGSVTSAGPNVRLYSANAGSAAAVWTITGGLQLDVSGANTFSLGMLSGSGNISGHFAQTSSQVQTLSVGALGIDSTYAGTITNNAVNNTSFGTQDSAANNVLALTKVGTGALSLTGANTYTGATTLSGGSLYINGTLAPSGGAAINTGTGTTFGGNGTVGDAVNISGVHAPGTNTAPGAQSINGALTYAASAQLAWGLATNTTSGGSVSAQNVSITPGAMLVPVFNGPGSVVNFTNAFWAQPHTWTVMTGASISGTFALGAATADSVGNALSSYGTLSLTQSGSIISVNFTPQSPEAAWAAANFGANASNPAIAGDTADPDHDGISNLMEYAMGTNPNVANAAGAGPQVSATGSRLTITFTRNTTATDITYTVMGADSVSGTWSALAQCVNGTGFTVVTTGATVSESGTGAIVTDQIGDAYLTTDPAHPKRFLKLQVTH